MSIRKLFLLTVILFFAAGSIEAADEALIFRFKGQGVDQEFIVRVHRIFSERLDAYLVYDAESAEEVIGNVDCESVSCAIILAGRADYPWAVTGLVTRIGNRHKINIQLIDVDDRSVMTRVEGTAGEAELGSLLDTLAEDLSIAESRQKAGEVTSGKSAGEEASLSFTSLGLSGSAVLPADDSFDRTDLLYGAGLVLQHETPAYFISGRAGLNWGEHDALNLTVLEAAAGKFLLPGDFSPYISGGLGIQRNKLSSDSGTGALVRAGLGLEALRSSRIQLQLELDYFITFYKLEMTSGEEKYPQGYAFTLYLKYAL